MVSQKYKQLQKSFLYTVWSLDIWRSNFHTLYNIWQKESV